jgi:osmoprotectant transport system permease protein
VTTGRALWAIVLTIVPAALRAEEPHKVVVGSKAFTESVVLGELLTQVARQTEPPPIVTHRQRLGGTAILWKALLLGGENGGIDLYPEYTGTIREVILAGTGARTDDEIRAELKKHHILMSRPLGFHNGYTIGVREEVAAKRNITKISDLKDHPDLRLAFSNEFMERGDGWPSLRAHYGLPQQNVRGLEHALAYKGLESGDIDATEVYTTDPEIRYYRLRILSDDLHHFPAYYAVILYREDLEQQAPEVVKAVLELEGRIPRAAILEMNSRAKPQKNEERVAEDRIAADFLTENPYFHMQDETGNGPVAESANLWKLELRLTGQHLYLTAVSLLFAIVVALPLGVVAARFPTVGQTILGASGIVQTLPSLALLALLVTPFGLGAKPAIVALFLYSLLPIVRNTASGLRDISPQYRESAIALGLSPFARLRLVELPLAMRSILAGIKTAAIINVGTATLGGVIGAGGYGERIMAGLTLDNSRIMAQGAIPAALLALIVQGVFEGLERFLVPRGLRLKPAE